MKKHRMEEEWLCDAKSCEIHKGQDCYSCINKDHGEDGYFVCIACTNVPKSIPKQVIGAKEYKCKKRHPMKSHQKEEEYGCDAKEGCIIKEGEKCYACEHASHGEYGYVVCSNCVKTGH